MDDLKTNDSSSSNDDDDHNLIKNKPQKTLANDCNNNHILDANDVYEHVDIHEVRNRILFAPLKYPISSFIKNNIYSLKN